MFKKLYLKYLFLLDFLSFRRMSESDKRFSILWRKRNVRLDDKTALTNFDSHYIYHPAWAARVLAQTKPEEHIDISSTLHFSTLVSAFIPTKFYDYRPAKIKLSNFESAVGDLNKLPFPDNSVPSLSCLHTIEHVGLGRYGDPLDPAGDLKAIKELKRVLAPQGNLLIVVPIGKPQIAFNAHRIYSYQQIVSYFSDLELKSFALIPDDGEERGLIEEAAPTEVDKQNYGCGCFWFKKL